MNNKLFSYIPSFIFIMSLFVMCQISFASTPANATTGFGFDMSNQQAGQNYFIITEDVISTQKDETQLEAQRLSAQAEYNLKREIKQTYLNELWTTYSATILLVVDLFIMFFLLIFIRLLFFILLELIPMGINKIVDYIEGVFEK